MASHGYAELSVSSRTDTHACSGSGLRGRSELALAECRDGGRRFLALQTQTTGHLWGIQLPQDDPTPRMSSPLDVVFRVPQEGPK